MGIRFLSFTSADTFRHYLKMISDHTRLPGLGLVLVNQEGEKQAGIPSRSYQVREVKLEGIAEEIVGELMSALVEGNKPNASFLKDRNSFIIPIIGAFRTTVGYIFSIGNIFQHRDILDEFSRHISLSMENSKKSEFHKKFSANVSDTVLGNLFALISETITQGLYADKVIVWEVIGERLISLNDSNFNMLTTNSLAGQVVRDDKVKIVDNIDDFNGEILLIDDVRKLNLSAFFLIPVHSSAQDQTVGVVGVFYKRPFGTTDVDLDLATYVVRYFQVIWDTISRNVQLESAVQMDDEARRFHSDAVSCILKLHEISDIRMGLQIAFDELDTRTANHSDALVRDNIKLFREQLRRLRELHGSQEDVFRKAEDYVRLVVAREERKNETIDLTAFVEKELTGLRLSAESLGISFRINFDLPKKRYFLDKEDLATIVSNLSSNAIRAIEKRRDNRENSISVAIADLGLELEISVQDTGIGIAPYELEKIFDPHYSTNRDVGGQGLGLAVLKATCLKHGSVPKIRSQWGQGTEASARMRHY